MSDADFALKLFLVVATVTGFLGTLTGIIVSLRRKPPIAEEIYKDFATKAEVAQLRADMLRTWGEVFEVLRQNAKEMSTATAQLTGQVRLLEGILSRCPGPSQCAQAAPAPR